MNTATLSDVQNFMDRITTTPERTPGRFLVYGDGGLGKTSWAAYSRNPIFAMSRGETGLETLINSGQISPTPSISLEKWEESEQFVDWLLNERHDYGTLVFDAINGFEHMLYEYVCKKDYGGVWTGGKDSFMSWYQGHRHATTYWSAFFDKLDELRKKRNMSIILLCHQQVTNYDNPEGADYHRIIPDMYKDQYHLVKKWCDAVLHFSFLTETKEDSRGKVKGLGGQSRVCYTERKAAFDAKNRYGLPSMFSLGDSAQEGWSNFVNLFKKGKEGK